MFQANLLPKESIQAEIAVVIDEHSNSYTEGNCGYFRQFRKLINQLLPHSGMPFDVITLDDMFKRAPYKLYIFRDLFHCNSSTRKKLRHFVKNHNSSCVWFYAAGTIDENGIETDNSYSLTNIKLKTHNTITTSTVTLTNQKHSFCANLQLPLAFSDTSDINTIAAPVFSVNDPKAEILGQLESLELPGIACKYESGRFDLWSASPQLDSAFCANIARAANCRQQAPVGVMTFGSGSTRMFLSRDRLMAKIRWNEATTTLLNPITGDIYSREGNGFNVLLSGNSPILLVE